MNPSKNGIAIVMFVLGFLGVNVAEADLIVTVATIMQIVSGLIMTYHQVVERKDVYKFLFKRTD